MQAVDRAWFSHVLKVVKERGTGMLSHDGGIGISRARLPKTNRDRGVIACPVGDVSDEACIGANKRCRCYLKPVVIAESSGLSPLSQCLSERS